MHFNCTQNNEKCTKQKLQKHALVKKYAKWNTQKWIYLFQSMTLNWKKLYRFIFIRIWPPRTGSIYLFDCLPFISIIHFMVRPNPSLCRAVQDKIYVCRPHGRNVPNQDLTGSIRSFNSKYLLFFKKWTVFCLSIKVYGPRKLRAYFSSRKLYGPLSRGLRLKVYGLRNCTVINIKNQSWTTVYFYNNDSIIS